MKRTLQGLGGLAAVLALSGALLGGSQLIRGAQPRTADVVTSPSPTDTPTDTPPVPSPTVLPSCVPGEGNSCGGSSPIAESPLPSPAATPDDTSARTTGAAGQIQASLVTFSTGNKLGVSVAILHQSTWVVGANVSVHCTGNGWSDDASGATALRSTWAVPGNGPRPPTEPGAFFWAQISGPGSGETYTCTGTATWSGLSTSFSLTARA